MKTYEQPSKRIEEIDIVKGIAIIFVFFRHVTEITGVQALNHPHINLLFTCFESFMILYILFSGYVSTSKGSILQGIGQRAKRLLIPLLLYGLFFTVLYFIRYVIIEGKPFIWFLDNTITNFLGLSNWNVRLNEPTPNLMLYAFAPYWFLIELFTAFCLFIPVKKFVDNKGGIANKIIAAMALMSIAMILNFCDVQGTLANTFNSYVPFYFILINIFGFSAVLMIGNILKYFNVFDLDKLSNNQKVILALICFTIDTFFVLYYNNNGYALQYGNWGPFGCLNILFTTIDGFLLTYLLLIVAHYLKKLNAVKKSLYFLGANSMEILILHLGIAEFICFVGGFWYDVYHEPYPVEKFSLTNFVITVFGTMVILGIVFIVKYNFFQKTKTVYPKN